MAGPAESRTVPKSQEAVRRLLLLTFCLAAVVLVGVTVLVAEGSRLLDDLKTREDRFLIANAVDRISTRQVSDMTSVTVWDQAFANLAPAVTSAGRMTKSAVSTPTTAALTVPW